MAATDTQTAIASTSRRRGGFRRATELALETFQQQQPVRAGSLIISIFGDSIAPRGGTVWLGSLIDALSGFGISQRSVRTAVFRLSRDGWLKSEPVGRRSYYSATAEGRKRFQDASRRIYSEPRQHWSGRWTLIVTSGLDPAAREIVRRELKWQGFAAFNATLMAHPSPDMVAVKQTLSSLDGSERLLITEAVIDQEHFSYLREVVQDGWSLSELGARYARFLDQFRKLYRAAQRSRVVSPEHAFQVRTLLIHEYRKILLRDPLLPQELLPGKWDGVAAYQLCRNLYMLVFEQAEQYLAEQMETADGPLPPAEPEFFARFSGLPVQSSPR